MRRITTLGTDDRAVRTQITLTKKVRALVAEEAKKRNESLSEYLRKAAMLRWLVDQEGAADLQKMADGVIGSVNLERHPEWKSKAAIQKWLQNLRRKE